MEIGQLKTSLFGFSKEDVYDYIAQRGVDMDTRLKEAREKDAAAAAELRERNSALENDNSRLIRENSRLLKAVEEKDELISSLQSRLKSTEEHINEIDDISAMLAKVLYGLKDYSADISELVDSIRTRLDNVGREIDDTDAVLPTLPEEQEENERE